MGTLILCGMDSGRLLTCAAPGNKQSLFHVLVI